MNSKEVEKRKRDLALQNFYLKLKQEMKKLEDKYPELKEEEK